MKTFEELRAAVDEDTVATMVAGFEQNQSTGEDDVSDEAFVAMLLGVREEVVNGKSWWFRGQVRSGAECEIHYAMKVDDDTERQRRAIVRDFVDTMNWNKKQRSMVEDLLVGWLEP